MAKTKANKASITKMVAPVVLVAPAVPVALAFRVRHLDLQDQEGQEGLGVLDLVERGLSSPANASADLLG